MSHVSHIVVCRGGLDLATPLVALKDGRAIAASNYEPCDEGYRRLPGIERFDGRPKPSKASYSILAFDAGSAAITEGQAVTGATSGATGKALIDAVVQSGSYGGGNAVGYLVLTTVTGTFQDNENLQVAAVTKSVANGTAVNRGATTDALDSTYYQDAITTARALIQVVPGEGRALGVHIYNGVVYAFRNNVGSTAAVMHKATSTGWSAQSLGFRLHWDAGSAEVSVGQTVTGGTSGATGVVTGVARRTGTYGGSTAVGIFTFASITGTFQNNENLQVGGVTKCVADGTQTANALPANGRYECITYNFSGQRTTQRMYGVNGVGPAFEWDGTTFIPLFTAMTTDTPNHIAAHRNHLFLSFPGGSVQYSGILDPYAYSVLIGAGEIAMGSSVTQMVPDTETVMAIFSQEKIGILYGDDSANFVFKLREKDAGAIEWTAGQVGAVHYMDREGVRSLASSQNFGDFSVGTISRRVSKIIEAKKALGVTADGAVVFRSKSQYRLFFSDNSFMVFWFGTERPEIMMGDYGKRVRCVTQGTETDGAEGVYFGSDDGYVYQMDAGTSLDGSALSSFITLPSYCRRPRNKKRFKKLFLTLDSSPLINLSFVFECGEDESEQPAAVAQALSVNGGGGYWNINNWNQFYWSGSREGRAQQGLEGSGIVGYLTLYSEAIFDQPHTLKAATINYVPGALER